MKTDRMDKEKVEARQRRTREIAAVYKLLDLDSDEARKRMATLGTVPSPPTVPEDTVFAEAGTTSFSSGEMADA